MSAPEKKPDDGGTAYPYAFQHEDDQKFVAQGFQSGMSLLDYFAGEAIFTAWRDLVRAEDQQVQMTIGGRTIVPGQDVYTSPDFVAEIAYDYAASMIAEKRRREKHDL